VTDRLSKLEAMKKVLAKIDIPPQQVLIQARLLDITHTDQDNLGLKLSSVAFDIPLRAPGTGAPSPGLLSISSGSLDVSGPSSDLTTDTLTATITRGAETLTAAIDALIRNKRVKVLASPTVATVNNVEAKITIGEKYPIKETTQTTTGTLQTTRFVDVGITLRVTPRINRAGFIQMQIHPEVSSVSSTVTDGPRITTREADTTIIVKERESVVIAGLIKEEETLIRDRIPIVGHIPLLGLLFQNRAKSYEQKELVIVITPYLVPVLPPQVVEGSEIEEARQRLDAMEVYRQGIDFELGKTFQAWQTEEAARLLRAMELYEDLVNRFPSHPLAPEALWRVGDLSWSRFSDASRAEEALTRLSRQYPGSPYAPSAVRRVKEIHAFQARGQRKRTQSARKASQQALLPPGFR
jgi:type II secretory pathway component GspD/PulD (secretin)